MLETKRLRLTRPALSDYEEIVSMLSAQQVTRFLGEVSEESVHTRFLRNEGCWSFYGYGPFVVSERESGQFVGQCGLFHGFRGLGPDFDGHPEGMWVIAAEHWGKGYAAEAMQGALAQAESHLGFSRTVALIAEENAASLRVADRLGYEVIRECDYQGERALQMARERKA